MQVLAYLLARFSEPSSYAGLGAVLALFGLHFSDSLAGQLAQCLAALCALAALFLKERGVLKSLALAIGLAAALGTSLLVTACAPAEAVAKLAAEPSSAEWVNGLIDAVHNHRPSQAGSWRNRQTN